MRAAYRLFATLLVLGFLLAGCDSADNRQQVKADPVAFEKGDECHVCGMIIERFPGPKGETISADGKTTHKFCSTRDLMSWLLQPENRDRPMTVYVHDMAKVPWEKTGNQHLIDARKAWYVAGSSRKGAMGPTLASFASKADAEAFAQEYGGEVLAFDAISLDTLRQENHPMGG
ncbi:nitrous oxide reductase accessory protein NosL [Marinobacteraceae bacterium S3BR75-40.1]